MYTFINLVAAAVAIRGVVAADDFNILQHVGGNGQWFPGPEVTGISSNVPSGCTVELAAFFSRHGSRYPDTGAYNGWVELSNRLEAAGPWNVTDEKFQFLKTWKPVLSDPQRQIAQISPTGKKELEDMGKTWRRRYAHLHEFDTPFTMWANYYKSSPRVRDSARYFAQGFMGPKATELTTIYALNASDPASWMNSLAPSDLCGAYNDEGGSPYKDEWDAIWIPAVRSRLNAKIQGAFNFTEGDVQQIPYLCGFETQIAERRSPFCDLLTEDEVLLYEYSQDLRYWYGTGLGSDIEKYQMLPVLDMVTQRFMDGPNAVYKTANTTFIPPKIMANFANDGQINQLIAALGIFDDEPQLPGNRLLSNRKFRSSLLTPMRGTVAFERLYCPSAPVSPPSYCGATNNSTANTISDVYMRIRLNEVVYPVNDCDSGPGSSCPLSQYRNIVRGKFAEAGSFTKMCNVTDPTLPSARSANFFMDTTLPFSTIVKP
ncbi:histidine phosphatase superfamily [Phaeosphaeriaceae sp. PMI808]|nr:histidine phosphatase superfamily [Phaeosphaeriaceae sp. PMI808]